LAIKIQHAVAMSTLSERFFETICFVTTYFKKASLGSWCINITVNVSFSWEASFRWSLEYAWFLGNI